MASMEGEDGWRVWMERMDGEDGWRVWMERMDGEDGGRGWKERMDGEDGLSLIHISERTRLRRNAYAVFSTKKQKTSQRARNSEELQMRY